MIKLLTGIPGSGKSLNNVCLMHALIKRWMTIQHFDEARPVFVHNIPDLLIPHAKMPLKEYIAHKGAEPLMVPDWDAMPDESIVLIDECAEMFPPRSSASAMPPHVLFLTVHRKRGFDIWFTTQHPKFIDHSLRALVGKHQHYRRIFGMQRSLIYEWDGCSDNLGGFKNATKSFFNFPKDIYKLYKSAEVHTKQSFRIPFWAFIPVIGAIMAVFFIPRAYAVLSGAMTGKGVSEKKDEVSSSGQKRPADSAGAALAAPKQAAGADLYQDLKPLPVYEPYGKYQLSVVGFIEAEKFSQYYFDAVENGRHVRTLSSKDLKKAGYEIQPISECAVKITYADVVRLVNCGAEAVEQASQLPQLSQLPQFKPLAAVQ